MSRKKVFVTQQMRHLKAEQIEHFGDIEYLTMEEYYPREPDANRRIINSIRQKMKEYIPGHDYILLTGSAIPNLIAGSCMNPGKHMVLKWSKRDQYYRQFEVII